MAARRPKCDDANPMTVPEQRLPRPAFTSDATPFQRLGTRREAAGYQNRALELLLRHADLEHAQGVVELGCGMGRLAARMLRDHLPRDAAYLGVDVSEDVVALANERLARWGANASVAQGDGTARLPVEDGSCDRFVSTYVFDLLSEDQMHKALGEAKRVLAPGGLLCTVSVTLGRSPLSHAICAAWSGIHRHWPSLVAGRRPIDLRAALGQGWDVRFDEIVDAFGFATQVIVAAAAATP